MWPKLGPFQDPISGLRCSAAGYISSYRAHPGQRIILPTIIISLYCKILDINHTCNGSEFWTGEFEPDCWQQEEIYGYIHASVSQEKLFNESKKTFNNRSHEVWILNSLIWRIIEEGELYIWYLVCKPQDMTVLLMLYKEAFPRNNNFVIYYAKKSI